MLSILAIDPGPEKSAFVHINDVGVVERADCLENIIVLEGFVEFLANHGEHDLAIEDVACYGRAVGRTTFDTCKWIGRFVQAWVGIQRNTNNREPALITNPDVRLHLCNTKRAKDGEVRRAAMDRFQPSGGGKDKEIGTKSNPGPLYEIRACPTKGVTEHLWSALAVAVTFQETAGGQK